MTRTSFALLCVFVSPALLGCAELGPQERGRLAHPTMAPGHGASLGVDHQQALQEGATGGTVKTSSGCGCN